MRQQQAGLCGNIRGLHALGEHVACCYLKTIVTTCIMNTHYGTNDIIRCHLRLTMGGYYPHLYLAGCLTNSVNFLTARFG